MFTNKTHEAAYNKQKDGDLDKAIQLYTKALAEAPDDYNIISDRAVAYLHKEDKIKCFEDFDRAIELQPDYAYRYATRAFAKNHFGDIDGAVEDYEIAVNLDPTDGIAQNNLGMLLEKKGYKNQADERFKRADELSKQEDGLLDVIDELEGNEDETEDGVSASRRPSDSNVQTESEEPVGSQTEELKKVFTSKSQFKEFIRFIKNGFKIK